jgi:hypothetical protein
MTTPADTPLKPLAPLARTIADTVRDTPIRLGSPDGAADLVAQLTVKIAAYMGSELGPDAGILGEIQAERARQDAKFGEQNHPDMVGDAETQCDRREVFAERATYYRAVNDSDNTLDWTGVLLEEVYEALAEANPARLRAELVQVAAVAAAWIAAIDRRTATHPTA